MRITLVNLLTLCCLFLAMSSQSFAEDKKTTVVEEVGAPAADGQGTYYLCKLHNVVRTMRIKTVDGNCEATYTKEGVDRVVGKSGTPAMCLKVISNIKENLEKAAWKCKDISSQARVSFSIEQ